MRTILTAICAALLCCTGPIAHAEKPDEKVQVTGQVVDAQGAAARGARIWAEVHDSPPIDLAADAQGRFTIELPKTRFVGTAIVASVGARMGIGSAPPSDKAPPQAELRIELGQTKPLEVSLSGADAQPVAGARTGLLIQYQEDLFALPTVETDAGGKALLLLPAGAECRAVFAYQPGVGFDYQVLKSIRHPTQSRGWPADGRVSLSLDATRKLAIHAEEADEKPVADLALRLWTLQKPGEPEEFNLSFTPSLYRVATDATGVAHFDDLPAWDGTLQFWPGKGFAHRRITASPATQRKGTLRVVLDRLVTVSGKVELPDGRPASGIKIVVDGADRSADSFGDECFSDSAGNFEIGLVPEVVYILAVQDDKWGAATINGLLVRPTSKIVDLKFTLQPATRVAGRVLMGPQRRPVAGQNIAIYQYGRGLDEIEDVFQPQRGDPSGDGPNSGGPTLTRSAVTDSDGHYEYHLGPGKYELRGPTQAGIEHFEITDQNELTFDFAVPRPEKGPFAGTVVDGKTNQPIAGATLLGIFRHELAADLEMITDSAGRFDGQRMLHPVVVRVTSPDKKLTRVVDLGPEDTGLSIKLEPRGSALGKIVDHAGKPVADAHVQTSVPVYLGEDEDEAPFRHLLSADGRSPSATTDRDGKFELTGLIVGAKYQISCSPDAETYMYGSLRLDSADNKPLIALETQQSYHPPTTEELIATALTKEPKQHYAAALSEARFTRQHVAIIWVDPEAEATRTLFQWCHTDSDVASALVDYQRVFIDAKGSKAKEVAKSLHMEVPPATALPRLILRDADEKQLAVASGADLSPSGSLDKNRLVDFLKASALEPLDAQKLLDEALADARKSGRRVLLQETGISCPPCHLLSHYLEKNRANWEKGFIWVRMDLRWKGCEELMDRIKAGYRGGIPWMAILDADGKLLATSNGPRGENIGFPSSAKDIDFFLSKLRETGPQLTADDLDRLRAALKEKPGK